MKKLFPIILILAIIFVSLVTFASCTQETPAGFELTKDLLASYSVVIPEDCGEEIQTQANQLCSDIKAAIGKAPTLKSDLVIEGLAESYESEYEILFGKVDRKEVKSFYKDVKTSDHGYALVGKKIIIAGYDYKMLKSSIYDFRKEVLNSTESVLLRDGDNKIVKGVYDFDTIMLNGTSINKYTIVYPSRSTAEENSFATRLRDWISEKTGYLLDVSVDKNIEKTDFEIEIGNTNRITDAMIAEKNSVGGDDTYSLYGKDNLVWLSGKTTTILRCAISDFCGRLTSDGVIDISNIEAEKPTELSISVLSYNIYYNLSDKDRDPQGVLTSIAERMPDVFGTVETTDNWFKLFDEKFGDSYTVVKGKKFENVSDGLYNAIFFKKGMFTLIESGTRWFSDTPNKVSKLDNSPHYKGITYAVLKDKATGVEFVYVSAHTSAGETRSEEKYNGPNGDGSNARKCREQQIEILKELLEKFSLYPIIIGGDFNAKPDSKAIGLLTSGTRYVNTTSIADEVIYTEPASHPTLCRVKKIGEDGNTIPPYTEINPNANQIDYFFVTKDSITVQKFEEWDNKVNGKYPSDHIPVCAEITIFGN